MPNGHPDQRVSVRTRRRGARRVAVAAAACLALTGGRQDDGGPTVVLHWNGHRWHKVAEGNFGFGTQASLPGGPERISVGAVAPIPGTTELLAGGNTHAYENPGRSVVAVLLQYEV